MDNNVTADAAPPADKLEVKDEENTESDFQKFIYELFDKNGIINDLRAHLRRHIVNVLNAAQTRNPPPCQKNFTERLKPRVQALNMLLAEYLLRLEFNYTLSVFVSEMPLANMTYDFAKSLMTMSADDDVSTLHFDSSDIWAILNSLGIKLDSESVCNIAHMYKNEDCPLLLCIMRCLLTDNTGGREQETLSDGSTSHGSELVEGKNRDGNIQRACQHHLHCTSCREREVRLKEKYRRSKSSLAENLQCIQQSSVKVSNSAALMKNISLMEKDFIDEMFHQLRAVYEAEVEMVKEEERKKNKHNYAGQLILLQNKKDRLEQSFEARKAELERNVQDKKRFLWGLAGTLRSQHASLARAVRLVRAEGDKLNDKEEHIKRQLAEAEATLRQRGDDIRSQISNELTILSQQLEAMKIERDAIAKERLELDNLKKLEFDTIQEKQDLHLKYDNIKSELSILKKYLESTKPDAKTATRTESCTNTEIASEPSRLSLNNSQVAERCGVSEASSTVRINPNQLVNNLKKLKNVNFSSWDGEEWHRATSSTTTVAAGRKEDDTLPPERRDLDAAALRELARQQSAQIACMSAAASRMRGELSAARRSVRELRRQAPEQPPPARPEPFYVTLQRASTGAHSSPDGAGEQLLALPARAPRVVVPGDTLPFVGVVGERSDARRHLISQWRAMRRGSSPPAAAGACQSRQHLPGARDRSRHRPSSADARIDTTPNKQMSEERQAILRERIQQLLRAHARGRRAPHLPVCRRDKSPRSLLKEAKARLRNQDASKPCQPREKSPSSVLKEARLRLKKLEIEAEAVERSYRDYREGRGGRGGRTATNERDPRQPSPAADNLANEQHTTLQEFNTALSAYTDKCNSYYRNRNTAINLASPIPDALRDLDKENNPQPNRNYLETPLPEFRKLYRTPQHARAVSPMRGNASNAIVIENTREEKARAARLNTDKESKRDDISKTKKERETEFEMLKQNIQQMYNLKETSHLEDQDINRNVEDEAANVEDEEANVEENPNMLVNEIKSENNESNGFLLFVESSIESHKISKENIEGSEIVSEMTIIIAPEERNVGNETQQRSRSRSPEHEAKLTRNDVLEAICNDHDDELSANSQEETDTRTHNSEHSAYPDDFSADVDNYDIFHADGILSPTSVPTDDDVFWGN